MKHSILVTGGAGFIGSHLADELLSLGHEVRILDSLEPQVHGDGRKPPKYLNRKAEFQLGDVRDRAAVRKALEGVDVVFHMASAVGVGQSMYQIDRYVDVNCKGTGLLLDEIVTGKHGVKRILLPSSMTIYGEGLCECGRCGKVMPDMRPLKQLEAHKWELRCPKCGRETKPVPTPEDKPLNPLSVYAVTKRDQEALLMSVGKAYGIPSVILRLFNVYGPRQSLSNPYTGVTAIFQSNIKSGNQPTVYEDGLQSRDFIHVKDVARAFALAMESGKADYGVYNVGSGKATPIRSIAETFAKLYGKDIKPKVMHKYRAADIRHCTADIRKIRRIGFKPTISFKDGMMDLVEWGRKEESVDLADKAHRELEERRLLER
jgi:dTDP-L-rhamnose 4-epimerase